MTSKATRKIIKQEKSFFFAKRKYKNNVDDIIKQQYNNKQVEIFCMYVEAHKDNLSSTQFYAKIVQIYVQ